MNIVSAERDRAKARAAVESRGLVSLMNDTKWRELVSAVRKLPFAPAFQSKSVLEAEPFPSSFESDVWYSGDWSEGLCPH